MFVLKKLKASTLMETMVATVLIVVLFMMASLIINSLMAVSSKSNLTPIKEHINSLEYGFHNQSLPLPYYEDWSGWEITGEMTLVNGIHQINISALNQETQQNVNATLLVDDFN